jgi:5'-phosphate synthase pdxT subunit
VQPSHPSADAGKAAGPRSSGVKTRFGTAAPPGASPAAGKIGVLALQGAFARHVERLRAIGALAVEVRTAEQLSGVDALVMPGGESTTMSNLLGSTELFDPIAERIDAGMPVFGTCAGMILLADKILDGRDDQRHFGVLDITVRRNGYGRQVDSFEADLELDTARSGGAQRSLPFHGVFIRAPRVEAVGPDVEVLASFDGDPVLVRQGRLLAACFHPELTDDVRLHQLFLSLCEEAS